MENGILINSVDPLLISIYNIKDIEEIVFSDLVPFTTNGRMNVIPNIYLRYDGGKTLVLCSKDKYFDIFVKKVFEVYQKEKDRVIIDPKFDPFSKSTKIKIDDNTKKILESGDLTKVNNVYEFYSNKRYYENSLLFQSDEFRLYLPIIEYHLKELFKLTNMTISFIDENIRGYRKNYTIDYKIDGIDDTLLMNVVSIKNNEISVFIRSRDRKFHPIEMKISFNKNSIVVESFIKEFNLYSKNDYEVGANNTITSTHSVSKDYLSIVYEKNELQSVDNPFRNISGIDSDDNMKWFILPWNAYYGVDDRKEKISDVEDIVMSNNKYLGIVNDEFVLREYASKEYRRKKTMNANQNKVIMDEVSKRIYGILLYDNIYLLETYFDSMYGSNGYYNTYLKDHYFYHLASCENGLTSLKREDLVSVSSEDDIIRNGDLLVKEDIKKILKR